ncbi:MAG TPA: hypothetical protein VH561_15895 [Micromonosporaceae bacterium]
MIAFEELAQRLAPDLAFLRVGDFFNLRARGAMVQLLQNRDELRAEFMPSRPLSDEETRWLSTAGWDAPRRGRRTWLHSYAWPLTAAAARDLAWNLAVAARSFVAVDIAGFEYDARNYDTWEPITVSALADLPRVADDNEPRSRGSAPYCHEGSPQTRR